jgi:hypothetical protein
MEAETTCWVCSLPLAKGERVARLASLGFEVHAQCAETVLRDEPPLLDDDEDPHLHDDR